MQNVFSAKNVTFKFLDELFFTSSQLSHKRIVNNLKRIKESFLVAFLVFEKQGKLRKLMKCDEK